MRPVPRMTARVVAIGVAALVAADVALVALALAHTSAAPATGSGVDALPVATTTGAPKTPLSPTATPSATPTTTVPATVPGAVPPTVAVEPVPLRSTLVALGEQATGPQTGFRLVIFVGMEIGEFEVRPVVKPCTLCAQDCQKFRVRAGV